MDESEHRLPTESGAGGPEGADSAQDAGESAGKLKCPACGLLNEPNAAVCTGCGQRFRARETSELAQPWGIDEPSFRSGEEPAERPMPEAGREPAQGMPPDAEPRAHEHAEAAAPAASEEQVAQDEPQEPEDSLRYFFAPSAEQSHAVAIPAGLGRRTMALVIDFIIVMILVNLLVALTGMQSVVADYQAQVFSGGEGILGMASRESPLAGPIVYLAILFFVLIVGYFGILSGYGGQTPGKALLGIKLLHRDGREVSLWVGILREFLMWLAVELTFGLYLVLAGVTVLLDSEGRSIHDFFFNTGVYHVPRA